MNATLNQLTQGESATVVDLLSTGNMRRRMLDIGLIEGTRIKCLQKSPSGDPIAYLIRGAVIALRSEDSKDIVIKQSKHCND